MSPEAMRWLSSGGAYGLVAVGWLASILLFAWIGHRLGKASDSPADGCLLQLSGLIMTLIGGSLGLAFFNFPDALATSLLGAFGLPALVTWIWRRGPRRRRQR